MKRTLVYLRLIKVGLLVCAGAALITVGVERYYTQHAQLIQRIEPDEAMASLFGEKGKLIGSPQRMIISDQKAFLEGRSADGALLVDESYIKAHGIYPLQLKSVEFLLWIIRLAIGSVAAFLLGLLWLANRQVKILTAPT